MCVCVCVCGWMDGCVCVCVCVGGVSRWWLLGSVCLSLLASCVGGVCEMMMILWKGGAERKKERWKERKKERKKVSNPPPPLPPSISHTHKKPKTKPKNIPISLATPPVPAHFLTTTNAATATSSSLTRASSSPGANPGSITHVPSGLIYCCGRVTS